MSVELATLIISVVILGANLFGATLNNNRYQKLKDILLEKLGELRERVSIIEAIHSDCPTAKRIIIERKNRDRSTI